MNTSNDTKFLTVIFNDDRALDLLDFADGLGMEYHQTTIRRDEAIGFVGTAAQTSALEAEHERVRETGEDE